MSEKTRIPKGLDEEKAMFLLERAEESFQSTISSKEAISRRASAVLGILGGTLALLGGAFANHAWTASAWDFLIATEFAMLLAVAWRAVKYFLIPSVKYAPPGIEPESVNDGEYVSANLHAMRWGYCMTLQNQMDKNREITDEDAGKLVEIVNAMLWSIPIAAFVASLRLAITQ